MRIDMTRREPSIERDEFGIPTGEHTLTCGCEMKGRSITKLCDQHLDTITTNYFMMPLLSPEERGRRILELVEEGVRKAWEKESLRGVTAKRFSWDDHIKVGDIPSVQNLKEEFEQLRRKPKWSLTEYARILHIEEHLDKDELVCRCYQGGPIDG